jgi:hypothetical protein
MKAIATAKITGDTYANRDAIRAAGYQYDATAKAWMRDVTSEANLAKLTSATAIPWKGCCREVYVGAALVARTYGPRDQATETRVGNCAACGSHGPLRHTLTGWVCYDCH